MSQSLRLVLISAAIATACSIAVVVVVVAAARPPVLISAPAASSIVESGVITSGDATVSKKPDIAFLSVGVESQQSTASAAQNDLATKAAKLIAKAKALGIPDKDTSTSGYWVGPYYSPGGQTISGYRASEQLQLKWHTVDTVGRALDALVQEGGAMHVSVSFGLADLKAARAEARTLAVADAHSRAQAMAGAAGVKVGQVLRISDVAFSGYRSAAYDLKAGAASTESQLPVGELNVTVTVEVAYAIA